jgi:peptidoglycan/xylan/chitin deacetylase (PgdA/CDA1 family)
VVVGNCRSIKGIDERIAFLRLGTGNVSLSRNVYQELGKFDEKTQPMEDWDYGARAVKANIPIISAVDLESLHQMHSPSAILQSERTRALATLKRKHRGLIASAKTVQATQSVPGLQFITTGIDGNDGLPSRAPVMNSFVAITIDDGPHHLSTPRLMHTLGKHRVAGTFFVLGSEATKQRMLLKELASAGHHIGVHGWNHTPSTDQTSSEIYSELSRSVDLIREVLGQDVVYCRPPYGNASVGYFEAASALNLRVVGWHLSTRDWAMQSSNELIRRIVKEKVASKVLLFHDAAASMDASIEALDWLLESCKERCEILSLGAFEQRMRLPTCATTILEV